MPINNLKNSKRPSETHYLLVKNSELARKADPSVLEDRIERDN